MKAGCTLAVLAVARLALADVRVTFNQDCTIEPDEWRLYAAVISPPGQPFLAGTIPNAPPIVCGDGIQAPVAFTLAGPTRFVLTAVAGTDESAPSNAIDVVPTTTSTMATTSTTVTTTTSTTSTTRLSTTTTTSTTATTVLPTTTTSTTSTTTTTTLLPRGARCTQNAECASGKCRGGRRKKCQ